MKDGQPFKMSKRAANFVTLRELLEEAGADATRFFFLLRRGDMALDFDLDLAKKRSSDNPVFYVQYGHARCAGILRKAAESPAGAAALEKLGAAKIGVSNHSGSTMLGRHRSAPLGWRCSGRWCCPRSWPSSSGS